MSSSDCLVVIDQIIYSIHTHFISFKTQLPQLTTAAALLVKNNSNNSSRNVYMHSPYLSHLLTHYLDHNCNFIICTWRERKSNNKKIIHSFVKRAQNGIANSSSGKAARSFYIKILFEFAVVIVNVIMWINRCCLGWKRMENIILCYWASGEIIIEEFSAI